MANFISENQIEQALLQRLQHVCGFDVLNCHTADPADLNDGSGRIDKRDVLLPAHLTSAALARLSDRRWPINRNKTRRKLTNDYGATNRREFAVTNAGFLP